MESTLAVKKDIVQSSEALQMLSMITGFWTSCCISVAAKLNIADLLYEKPRNIQELSIATASNSDALNRVLRALCSVGVFTENESHEFELTAIGNTLRSDVYGSMKAYAITQLTEHYNAWGNLLYSVKTGGIAFDDVYNTDIWKYFDANPDAGKNFGKAMSGLTEGAIMNILPSYNFSSFKKIIDIGGGNGGLLTAILNANKECNGIIYDEAYIETQANENIDKQDLNTRCKFEKGSFFNAVPSEGDCYIMKKILHDWNDDQSLIILNNLYTAMKADSKLLIIEAVIKEGKGTDFAKFCDINMLAVTGGRERTEKEWSILLSKANLKLEKVIPTNSPMFSMIEVKK